MTYQGSLQVAQIFNILPRLISAIVFIQLTSFQFIQTNSFNQSWTYHECCPCLYAQICTIHKIITVTFPEHTFELNTVLNLCLNLSRRLLMCARRGRPGAVGDPWYRQSQEAEHGGWRLRYNSKNLFLNSHIRWEFNNNLIKIFVHFVSNSELAVNITVTLGAGKIQEPRAV